MSPQLESVQLLATVLNCLVLLAGVKMNCTTTTDVSYAYAHVKLPTGWFLVCGMTVYSYVPAYSPGGPCSLGRLMVFMPQKPYLTRAQWDLSLAPDHNSDLHLLALLNMCL